MIVCTQCGNHNQDDDEFCGSCGKFLEWVGEKIAEPEPPPEPVVEEEPPRAGIVERVRSAVGLDDHAETEAEAAEAEAAARQAEEAEQAAEAEAARRQAEEAEQAEAARRQAEAQEAEQAEAARRQAEAQEAEARRAKEDADRRAAALLAKPKPPTPAPPPVAAPSVPAPAPAPEHTMPEQTVPAAQQPVAQQPAVKKAPRPAPKKAAARDLKPGDLICGQCGVGNDPQRRFCRKCGASLAEAVSAAKPPWWRRLFTRERGQRGQRGQPGGRRPGRGASKRARGAARTARSAGWRANRAAYMVRRALLILAVVGIGASLAVPSTRGAITDTASTWFDKAKLTLMPEFEIVNPVGADATSAAPGHDAGLLIDGASNTYWSEGVPGPGIDQIITVRFAGPVDLDKIIITSGASGDDPFLSQPRPKVLHIVYDNNRGMDLTLDDDGSAISYDLEGATQVTRVDLQIAEVYPSAEGGENTAISEIEFRSRKRA
jgi:hypothetical protein